MRVIARRTLREYWDKHPDVEQALRAWFHDVEHADWQSPTDVRRQYGTASILANNRVVFNIRGNAFRLVVAINYDYGVVYIRFVGTHRAYDDIDAGSV